MRIFRHLTQPSWPVLDPWREQTITWFGRIMFLASTPAAIFSIVGAFELNQPLALIGALASLILSGIIGFARSIPYTYRAWLFIITAFSISTLLLLQFGITIPSAWIIVLNCVMIAVVLLGRTAGIIAWLAGAGSLGLSFSYYANISPEQLNVLIPRLSSTTIFLVQILYILGIAAIHGWTVLTLMHRLQESLHTAETALIAREHANQLLEQRVAERTAELEQALANLHTSETRYKTLFQVLPVGVFITNDHDQILDANPASERLLGISADEQRLHNFRNSNWRLIWPDGSLMKVEDLPSVRVLREQQVVGSIEIGVIRPDQKIVWLSVIATPMPLPGYGAAVIYTDITARKQVEQTLAANEARQRALIDALPDLMFILSADGIFQGYYAPEPEMLLVPPEQFLGRSVAEVMPPNVATSVIEAIFQARATRKMTIFEYIMPEYDSKTAFECRISPIDSGEMLVLIRNITERKRVAHALLQAKESAEAAARATSSFLAHMSHEIRTPLNAVIGMASLLLDTTLSPAQQEYTTTIRTGGQTLLRIINNILDFSKIESGHMELATRPFDLNVCLREALDLMRLEATNKGLALDCLIDPIMPTLVVGDETRIGQMIRNLLSNAVKFTHQGHVMLHVTAEYPPSLICTFQFTITDTGIGIAPERLTAIFDPFVQADNAITRRYEGTGLGLAITRQLAELMDGQITVESTSGAGSTFTLRLPLPVAESTDDTTTDLPSTATPKPTTGASMRVLIAEDNHVNQQVIKLLLERLGCIPDIVDDGIAAVDAVKRQSYDILLLDIHMPHMDGETAARQIRALGDQITQPYIVALTASAMPGDRERFLATGMDNYLSKPVQLEDVRTILEDRQFETTRHPHPQPTSAELVDWTLLDHLLATIGDPDLNTDSIVRELFDHELATQLAAIEQAISDQNIDKIALLAHKLQGGSLQIGARGLANLASNLNAAAQNGQIEHLSELQAQLRNTYTQTLALVMQRFNRS